MQRNIIGSYFEISNIHNGVCLIDLGERFTMTPSLDKLALIQLRTDPRKLGSEILNFLGYEILETWPRWAI